MKELSELTERIMSVNNKTKSVLVYEKSSRALSDLKRAKSFVEKARATLAWCNREEVKLGRSAV
jgi:hypothetical protein